jgi:2-amino-4-hydroxy-6-hydroxymethyldihydropteridine diphosphokinase
LKSCGKRGSDLARAFVAIGSNIDPAFHVRASLRALRAHVPVTAISTVYCTEAENRPEQPPFYNCVVEIDFQISPTELKFNVLRPIEETLGRRRTSDKYDSRSIDLDLIIYGDLIRNDSELLLPDPEIANRFFLAAPLAELAPELLLPGTGVRVSDLAARLAGDKALPLLQYTAELRAEL